MPSGLAIVRSFPSGLGRSVTSKESSHMRQDRCSAKVHGLQIHSLLILSIVFAFSVNLLIGYSGVVVYDSRVQYAQAVTGHFFDTHPPIMAWVWSILRLGLGGRGARFLLPLLCLWAGLGLTCILLVHF